MKIEIDIKEILVNEFSDRRDLIAITLFNKDINNSYIQCAIRISCEKENDDVV